jgi:hypothetical protein
MGVPSPSIQTQGVGHLLGHLQFFGKNFGNQKNLNYFLGDPINVPPLMLEWGNSRRNCAAGNQLQPQLKCIQQRKYYCLQASAAA